MTALIMSDDDASIETPEIRWIDGESGLSAIGTDWLDLEKRALRPYLSQSFEWAWARVQSGDAALRRHVRCMTVWDGGKLVAVWPFIVRDRFGCRIAHRLGCGSDEDYAPPLIDAAADADVLTATLVEELERAADIATLPVVKADDPLYAVLERMPAAKVSSWKSEVILSNLQKFQQWADFEKTLSTKLTKSIRYEKNRIAKAYGSFSVRQTSDPNDIDIDLAFFLSSKTAQLDRTARYHWFHTRQASEFLKKTTTTDSGPGVKVLTAWAGERRVAAALCFADATRLVFFATTYDPAFALYSPGKLLLEGCLKWAFERGLNFDFGPVVYSYKERWGDDSVLMNSYTMTNSTYGRVFYKIRNIFNFVIAKQRKAKLRLKIKMVEKGICR